MSMNLHCKGFNLWQTPAQISNMCMVSTSGVVHYELKGTKALHALRVYEQWVKGSLLGPWSDSVLYHQQEEVVNEHLKKLNYFINCNKGKLEVHIT